MTFFDIWCIFNHFFIEILCLGQHFSIQVCLHFNWCVTAGKTENIHLPMQVPFCKIQKTIQGPKELNEKIDSLHWQCRSLSVKSRKQYKAQRNSMRKLTICIDNASPLRGLALYQYASSGSNKIVLNDVYYPIRII